MKKPLLAFLLLLCTFASDAQEIKFEWGFGLDHKISGTGKSIIADVQGNLYILSSFEGTIDTDPTIGIHHLTSNGQKDVLITKFDPGGNLLWAKSLGGAGNDASSELVIDASGNIYITGFFRGTVDFDPGLQIQEMTASVCDIFLLSLTENGNFRWTRQLAHSGSPWQEIGQPLINIDETGNVYIASTFKGTFDLDPDTSVLNVSASEFSSFVAKYNHLGNLVWGRKVGATGMVSIAALEVAKSEKIYIHGTLDDSQYFGDDYLETDTTIAYLAELNTFGNYSWAKVFGKNVHPQKSCMVADASGNLYFTGNYSNTAEFGSGNAMQTLTAAYNNYMYICMLDNAGNLIWVKDLETSNTIVPESICLDASGSIYISGFFAGNSDFDPGTETHMLFDSSSSSFTLKLNQLGKFVWATSIYTSTQDFGFVATTDLHGNVFITASFYVSSDIDPTPGTHTLYNQGTGNSFITKISQHENPDETGFVSIYPNPTSDFLHIFTSGADYVLEIYNSTGDLVFRQTALPSYNVIDISEFSSGTYLARIQTSEGLKITENKLIKL